MPCPVSCAGCTRGCSAPGAAPEGKNPVCWLYHHNDFYRGLWDGEIVTASRQGAFAPAVRHEPCQFLGEVLVREGCAKCWLRKCPVKGVCTTGQLRPGTACCQTCEDYQP